MARSDSERSTWRFLLIIFNSFPSLRLRGDFRFGQYLGINCRLSTLIWIFSQFENTNTSVMPYVWSFICSLAISIHVSRISVGFIYWLTAGDSVLQILHVLFSWNNCIFVCIFLLWSLISVQHSSLILPLCFGLFCSRLFLSAHKSSHHCTWCMFLFFTWICSRSVCSRAISHCKND